MKLRQVSLPLLLVGSLAATLLHPSGKAAAGPSCDWVAGDLHIHTTYSHDSHGIEEGVPAPDDAYTIGHSTTSQFLVAASRGMDFLAITDHNDVRSQSDPGFGAFGVAHVRGYEKSLKGHAQMLGADRIYDAGDQSAAAISAMADTLRAAGGVFQINHPSEGSVDHPNDPDWGYGYEVIPDTVEVWNISRLYQPPLPSASSNDDAIRYWEGWLDRGHRVGATGGSDNHYMATTAIQGAGQPTTWVCAGSPGEPGVLDGLRRGRTFISHQPPSLAGPRLFLEGDADGNGIFEAMVGDAVPPGATLRVVVKGAPGSLLEIITDGGEKTFSSVPVTSNDFSFDFTLPSDKTWVRAEILEPDAREQRAQACDPLVGGETTYCRNSLLVLAMTSALYLEQPQDDRRTTLVYDGEVTGRVGGAATFAATLSDAAGPLAGAPITFSYRGNVYQATTDAEGRAATSVKLTGPPGMYEIRSSFVGDEDHDPSSDVDLFTVLTGRP